ncbi:hypothetical protein cgp_0491 [Corynebacterium glutamicum MB001]|nr:hypothetical protein cgp_0491 [Corynebacterium glutamicum MB001]ASW13197.1 hypothetical protein cgc1_0491 [Corynebacterium glutamicum]QYO72659.1 hypothetical protein cgisf_0491 [Corynebacterium glutamicum]CAF19127.1 hypothetical protein cg0491 [Corynebacterium glutamicum ATCC 13032]
MIVLREGKPAARELLKGNDIYG